MQPGSVEHCVVQSAELLDHLGIRRAAVMGTSGGGMPAGRFAANYPDLATCLILQCSQAHRWDSGIWLPKGLEKTLFLFRLSMFRASLRWETRRCAKVAGHNPMVCLKEMSGSRFSEIADDKEVVGQIAQLTKMSLACARRLNGVENDWDILLGDNGIQPGMVERPQ